MMALSFEARVPTPPPAPNQAEPVAVFEAGRSIPVALRAVTTAEAEPERVAVRLVLRCHGSGTPQERTVVEELHDVPALEGATTHRWECSLAIPAAGPPSYQGEHVKLDWSVRITRDAADLVTVPILVRPPRAPGNQLAGSNPGTAVPSAR